MGFFQRFNTNSGDAHAKRGLQAAEADDYHTAAQELAQALEAGVTRYDAAELYTALGKAYERINQLERSVMSCRKAIELKPSYYPAWNNLGIALQYQGNLDEAERCYERAIALKPDYASPYTGLGAVYIARQDAVRAIEVLRKAIKLNPQLAVAHSNLAVALSMNGDFAAAAQELQAAISMGYKDWRKVSDRIEALKAWEEVRARFESSGTSTRTPATGETDRWQDFSSTDRSGRFRLN